VRWKRAGRGLLHAPVLGQAPRELLGGLLGLELGQLRVLLGEERAGLQLEQRRDEDEELAARVEVERVPLEQALDERHDDAGHVHLGQVELLLQHQRQEQVERPFEGVEVQLELGRDQRPESGGGHLPMEEEQLLRSYLAQRPAGVLLTGFDRTEAARQMVAASGMPCVYLMELTDAPGVHCVGFSQQDAGHGMTAHLLLTQAFRHAAPALLAPFSYCQIVFAGLLGLVVYSQVPDTLSLVGISVICLSGLGAAWMQRGK